MAKRYGLVEYLYGTETQRRQKAGTAITDTSTTPPAPVAMPSGLAAQQPSVLLHTPLRRGFPPQAIEPRIPTTTLVTRSATGPTGATPKQPRSLSRTNSKSMKRRAATPSSVKALKNRSAKG